MNLENDGIFHCYNRGNNRQKIFLSEANYLFFLRKIRKHVSPFSNILAYCLMPNHFHLLIHVNREADLAELLNNWRIMLSSYTRAINKANDWTGSLFQQKTKFKNIESDDQARICFNYIHQNPVNSKLVTELRNWEYSSFPDYCGVRNGTLINKNLAISLLDLPDKTEELIKLSKKMIPDNYNDFI